MSTLRNGDSVARYRVVSSIGAGGMGEVYKAVDDSLERNVALKILPPELTRNEERVRRFVQEAKSASSLSHPHIVSIYEIGQAEVTGEGETHPVHFIAMELVEGRTLKQEIHEERTSLRILLTCLMQAADALSKAHAEGIVHRDLKPDNIMISKDGYAKVLDFGLAKLTEKRSGAREETSAPTAVREKTREGTVMGTVGYMSPEQVQGKPADHRSDIFSFGCILYEAATRQRPFDADSDVDVMHRILHDKPQPIDELNPAVPGELRRLIRRCLAKEPDKRFQSMKDLSIELGEIVDEWDELSPKSVSGSGSGAVAIVAPRRLNVSLVIAGVALIIAVAAVIFALTRLRGSDSQGDANRFADMQIRRVTTSGKVSGSLAISADGRYVVHAVEEGGQFSMMVRQVATGADVRVVAPSPNNFQGATFTPDGNYLAVVQSESSLFAAVYLIPSLGGTPQRLLQDIDTPVTFSPDGKRFAFARGYQPAETALMVANADGTGERKLATSKGKERYQIFDGPAWSPDGKSIAIVKRIASIEDVLMLVDAATGAPRQIPHQDFSDIRGITWVPDGTALIIAAAETPGGAAQLWRVDTADGKSARITNDLTDYISVGITADGRTIAATQRQTTSNLWSLSREGGSPAQLTSGSGLLLEGVRAFGDHLIFTAIDQSGRHIWTSRLDGSDARPIVRDACCVAATPDGKAILFSSLRSGNEPQLFTADAGGGGVRQLTREQIVPGLAASAFSPDGSMFLYRRAGGETELMRASVAGGQPVVVARDFMNNALFSPDGKSIIGAFILPVGSPRDLEVRSHPVGGGPHSVLPFEHDDLRTLAWMEGGKAMSYLRTEDQANVWLQKLDGSAPVKLTDFKDGIITFHAWSPDERTLYLARGEQHTDVVLITDFN